MNLEKVNYELDDRGICTITMNAPESMNTLSRAMFRDLTRAFEEAGSDDRVRAVVLTGAGKGFCAGGDLNEMKEGYGGSYGFYRFMEKANRFMEELEEFHKPVIAKVNGAAVGAGMNLVLACDIAIASKRAKFGELHGNVGLIPDCGGLYLLPRVVGRSKAKEIVMTRRILSAEEALGLGIVTEVVSSGELDGRVDAAAAEIAAGPTFALGLAKAIINRSFELDAKTVHLMEGMAIAMASESDDHRAGVEAFFEGEKARFSGK